MENRTNDEVKDRYMKNFRAKSYHALIHDQEFEFEYFFLKSLASVFKKPEIQGSSLLEIGSGPTIPNIAFASTKFSHIVLSDLVRDNRAELEKWLNNDGSALDWSDRLKVCATLQGYKNIDRGYIEIESLIRDNVKAVIPCDVSADQIVSAQYSAPYDVILSCRAVEAACIDYSAYKMCMKKISNLVKPNGYFVLTGYLQNNVYYVMDDNEFRDLYLTYKDVQQALEEAGFEDCEWKFLFDKKLLEDENGYTVAFCLNCKKKRAHL